MNPTTMPDAKTVQGWRNRKPDIVDRLREKGHLIWPLQIDCLDAADEIELLREELARLKRLKA